MGLGLGALSSGGAAAERAEPVTGPAPALTYVTLNVLHGGVLSGLTGRDQDLERRLEIVAEELAALRPDIVGLQEASTSRLISSKWRISSRGSQTYSSSGMQ